MCCLATGRQPCTAPHTTVWQQAARKDEAPHASCTANVHTRNETRVKTLCSPRAQHTASAIVA
eukprot:8713460-Alexandrium_andersonii.AAC.1